MRLGVGPSGHDEADPSHKGSRRPEKAGARPDVSGDAAISKPAPGSVGTRAERGGIQRPGGSRSAGSGSAGSGTAGARSADRRGAGTRAADGRAAHSKAADSRAGSLFARITLLPPLLLMAWLLAGLPLLLAGQFSAGLVSITAAVLAVVLVVPVLSAAPLRWPHRRTPWWTLATVIAIAAGFGVWQGLMHSEQVIVRRDPATYLQFAYWIAKHGSLPIPQLRSAFGGEIPGLGFQSLGFYAHGTALVPQFMAGPPMVLAAAFWIKGIQLAVLTAPLFGACAVLTFGGLVGRLCGPRWAPLGALVLALSLPEVYTNTAGKDTAGKDTAGTHAASTHAVEKNAASTHAVGNAGGVAGTGTTGTTGTTDGSSGATSGDAGTADLGGTGTADLGHPRHDRSAPVRERRAQWVLAAVAGLAFGLSILVRIDGISEILPVILFCGVLYATRRQGALPMAGGLAVGAVYGLVDGYVLSRPYLNSLSSELRLLGYAAAGFAAVTIVLMAVSQWRRPRPPASGRPAAPLASGRAAPPPASGRAAPPLASGRAAPPLASGRAAPPLASGRPAAPLASGRHLPSLASGRWRWVPDVTALLAVAVMVAFAIRPLIQKVRGETNPTTIAFITEVQKLAHLPIDPHRTYAEDSLYWVIWYIGVPAVLLATFGAALLARRFLRGSAPIWGLPVMIIGWSVITTLWRPGIVPDQPWASRRLVPIVLPGLVLFAVWACGWLVGRARARGAGRVAQGAAASCCAVALLLPTAVTTFGFGVARTADGRVRLFANGLAVKRTDTAEIGVVNSVCRAIGRNA